MTDKSIKNLEKAKALIDEVFKIKEDNKNMYISMTTNVYKDGGVSVDFGSIGDNEKCFITGSIDLDDFETSDIASKVRDTVKKARDYKGLDAKDKHIKELEKMLEKAKEEE